MYKGNVDTPKGRKGKRTARKVGAVSRYCRWNLKVWQTLAAENWAGGISVSDRAEDSAETRQRLEPATCSPQLETVGLEWATFQVLRRTNASLSRKAKIDDKVAADQRGHGLGVSLEVYSISDREQKIEAAKRLESEVIQ